MASIDLILRKDKAKKNGHYPVYLRIIKDRRAQYILLKESVIPELWIADAQEVDRKHPNAKWLNAKFLKRRSEAKDLTLQAEELKRNIRTRALKEEVIGKAPIDFFAFAETFLNTYNTPDKVGTYRSRKAMIGKFRAFYGDGCLDLDNFQVSVLNDYIHYLRTELKNSKGTLRQNSNSTIQTNLKFLHTIFNQAIKENLATLNDDPFLRITIKSNPRKREYLTKEEIFSIEKFQIDSNLKLFHHRNMFLFSCYSGGLGIRELLLLKWKDVRNGRISFQRKKNSKANSFTITMQGQKILNYYEKLRPSKKDNHFVFPAMSNLKDYSDPRYLHNSISSQTTLMNKDLKKIQEKLELSKHLSSHIARHTFATMALSHGIPVDQVQHILGHSNIRETMIYAKTLNQAIDNSMKNFRI